MHDIRWKFRWYDFGVGLDDLDQPKNKKIVSDQIEYKLRELSEELRFFMIYKNSELTWIIDWSNRLDIYPFIKVYVGPYVDADTDLDISYHFDQNSIEVKSMFLDVSPIENIKFI